MPNCMCSCTPCPPTARLKLKPGIGEAELDALLRDQLLMQQVAELMKYQLIESDEDSYR